MSELSVKLRDTINTRYTHNAVLCRDASRGVSAVFVYSSAKLTQTKLLKKYVQ